MLLLKLSVLFFQPCFVFDRWHLRVKEKEAKYAVEAEFQHLFDLIITSWRKLLTAESHQGDRKAHEGQKATTV